MERLTKRDPFDGIVELTKEIWEPIAPYDEVIEALNKLAAYEDTGLEPEEIEKASKVIVSALNFAANNVPNMLVGRLKEIIRAEGEGRLLALPCKVGDMLWFIIDGKIHKSEVYRISYNDYYGKATWKVTTAAWTKSGLIGNLEDFGKTVFLTREEAEAALEKMSNAVD